MSLPAPSEKVAAGAPTEPTVGRSSTTGFIPSMVLHKRIVLRWVLGAAAVFFALTYVLPQTYESVATVLPPERHSGGGMLSLLTSSSASSPALDFLKGDNPTLDLFKTVLESRNIAEEVAKDPKIHKFMTRYDTDSLKIAQGLQSFVSGEALRTGMFVVTVDLKTSMAPDSKEQDSARVMSAYIANAFVEQLDRFNRDRLMTTARSTRIFIEQEYNNRMAQLDSQYHLLQQFQEANKAISLTDQLSATVTAAAKLTGEIQQMEVQLGIEERELGPSSPRIQMLRTQLEGARAQLQKYDDGGAGEYILALKNVPQLSRELAKYMREAKVLEQVCGYLRQQLEQERISEQRDLPSLQVLDAARAPEKRASPHRSIFTAVGLIIGALLGVARAKWLTYKADVASNPEAHYRYLNVVNAVKGGSKAKVIVPVATIDR